eukprot:6487232-Amphidinium_carterae.2
MVSTCLPCLASVQTTDRVAQTSSEYLHTGSLRVMHDLSCAFAELVSRGHAEVKVGTLNLVLDKTDRVLTVLASSYPEKLLTSFSVNWLDRISKALLGCCGLYNILPLVVASQLEEDDFIGDKFVSGSSKKWGLHKSGTDVYSAADKVHRATKEWSQTWRSALKWASEGGRVSCCNRVSVLSKELKRTWHAAMALVREGASDFDEASRMDADQLLEEATSSRAGPIVHNMWSQLNQMKKTFRLGDTALVNLARSFTLLPIPAQTSVTEEDIVQEFSKVPHFSEEQELELEVNYLESALSMQDRLRAALRSKGIPTRSPSTVDLQTQVWKKREHWLKGHEFWTRLSKEEKRELAASDSTAGANPVNW